MSKKKSNKKNKKDASKLTKKLNSNILDNKGVKALITVLAAAIVDQLLHAIASQGKDSQGESTGISKLSNTIKDAAIALQGMADGKTPVAETVETVKDAIADIRPVVAGMVPAVQGVVSVLKDQATVSKTPPVQEPRTEAIEG